MPASFSTQAIVDAYDLAFDPGDKANGSLYLCTLRGSPSVRPDPWITSLRAAGLWSDSAPKSVPDEQRQAYKDGLVFVAAVAYAAPPEHLVLARFDHPKFPSDANRWNAWVAHFDRQHERLA
jgi:hypothetical protein